MRSETRVKEVSLLKILVVEDDHALRKALVEVLTAEGYDVDETDQGDEGLFLAEQSIYDLLVLDIMLPGLSGLNIVQSLREKGMSVPVLFLTAKDSVEDRVKGLNMGADDYLVKPFAVPELLARMSALLRRKTGSTSESVMVYNNLVLNPAEKKAYCNQKETGLTVTEYELLEFLMLNRERILTREQIFDRLWGYESESSQGIVDVYVHHIRKKLAPHGCDTVIKTIRGVGYMLKALESE